MSLYQYQTRRERRLELAFFPSLHIFSSTCLKNTPSCEEEEEKGYYYSVLLVPLYHRAPTQPSAVLPFRSNPPTNTAAKQSKATMLIHNLFDLYLSIYLTPHRPGRQEYHIDRWAGSAAETQKQKQTEARKKREEKRRKKKQASTIDRSIHSDLIGYSCLRLSIDPNMAS